MTSQTKTNKNVVRVARKATCMRMMRTALVLLVALLAWPVELHAEFHEGDWICNYDDYNCVILTQYLGFDSEVTTPETISGHPVVEIQTDCFKNKASISKLTITSGVVKIGASAFESCTSLTDISLPNTLLEIGEYALSYCQSLTSVTLPERLSRIEKYLFVGSSKLESVTIPNGVTSIGEGAFQGCSSLERLDLPSSITQIGNNAFFDSGLTNLYYEGKKTQWEKNVTKGYGIFPYSSTIVHWLCTATFDMQGVGTAPAAQTVYSGSLLTEPTPEPSAQGYEFGGWYLILGILARNFEITIDDDEIIYAKWIPLENTIDFDTGGKGTTPSSQTLLSGRTVAEPGAQFVGEAGHEECIGGWYTDAGCTQAYDFSTPVDHTMTLYAKWVAAGHATFNVTNAGGGTCRLTDAKGRTFANGLFIPGSHTLTVEPVSGHTFSGSYREIMPDNGLMVSEITLAGSNKKTYSIDLTEANLEVNVTFSTRNILSIDIVTDGTATAGTYTIGNQMGQTFTNGSILENVADETSPWDIRYDLALTVSKGENVGCAVSIVNNGKTTTRLEDSGTYTITPYGSVDIELFFYDKTTGVLTLLDDDSTQPEGSRNADLISAADGKRRMVQLGGHTLYRDGGWNTICLPFDVKIEGSPFDFRGVEARTLSAARIVGNTLTLTFSEPVTTLEAGKPYIIKWRKASNNIVNPTFGGVTIKKALHPVVQTAVDFVGSFSPVSIEGEDRTKLYLGTGNTLYYPNDAMTISAGRAIFQLKGRNTMGEPDGSINSSR